MAIGLAVFQPFYDFIEWVSKGAGMQQKIANAHMLFNTAGVILFLPFILLVEKLLNRLLPQKQPQTLQK